MSYAILSLWEQFRAYDPKSGLFSSDQIQWYYMHFIAYLYSLVKMRKGLANAFISLRIHYTGVNVTASVPKNIMLYINAFVPKGLCILWFRNVRKNEMHPTSVIISHLPSFCLLPPNPLTPHIIPGSLPHVLPHKQ